MLLGTTWLCNNSIISLTRKLQEQFEADPRLDCLDNRLDCLDNRKRIKIEVDEQEPEQEPEYPGCEYFDGTRVDEDEDDEEDFYNAPVSTGSTGFLQDPIVRGLDFHSDVGWIRPKMVRNGW